MMQLSEAAIATKGSVIGQDVTFTCVTNDSRGNNPGQLFVAMKGERVDGHDFALSAITNGAAAVMVSQEIAGLSSGLLVQNTRLALGDLAAHWRGKFRIPLAAITGSNGKTTVKEMLACILQAKVAEEILIESQAMQGQGGNETATRHTIVGRQGAVEAANAEIVQHAAQAVLATVGNLNNDIGLPLTLLKLRSQHRYAVAEMGMNHFGEISYLTRIGRPTVALVNNATTAHLGGLGSVEGIAKAKGEIFEGLAEDGVAVINADDAFAPLWKSLAAQHKILTFGLQAAADVSASFTLHAEHTDISLSTPLGEASIKLPVAGKHNVSNALAATTVAVAMGASLVNIVTGLENFGGVKGRLQHKKGIKGAVVIDDTYNANPASMRAAIDVLAKRNGEKLLVLGDMGELGDDAAVMHAEIGAYAKQAGVNSLYVLGELSHEMVKAFGLGAQHFDTPDALVWSLETRMNDFSTVLVKGSRFMQMERVVNLIVEDKSGGKSHVA